MIFLESKYPQHPDLKKLSMAKKFAIVLQYSVILKVNLHRSSIVKKNTNILFKLYQFLSLSPVTLSSLFFFLLFFYYFHSLIQFLPLSRPSLPFHFFFLSIFPWIKGLMWWQMGLMWWSSWVWCGRGFLWWWQHGSVVLICVVEWRVGDQRGGFIDRCGGVVVSEIEVMEVMVVSGLDSSLSNLLFKPIFFKPKTHAHEHHH